ncbi:flagellar assembly protein FliH [Oceanimonas sp. CHS3-5]|uniref:flagellar assembly protein FliH n=1 Tax=Oceanimonas sp. CHS3-5 TaxID=3068186 RepID=UPI00273D875F|nr:flagellar assembly protein FliH [Oceanimonas sp. CHS3-5]MDP5290713.1 flagellar assembly protein FliH [Oceanimonas sp. CHS3-5]
MSGYNAKGRIPAGQAAWQWPELELAREPREERAALHLRTEPEPEPQASEPAEEAAPEPLTAEALDAIRQAAFEEGHAEGREQGLAEGREEGRLQGMQEGHEAGLQQGLEQGLAEGREQVQQQLECWSALTEQLQAPLAQIDHTVEQSLVILAMELSRNLLKAEASASPRLLLATVQEALQALPHHDGPLTFYLHADDLAMLAEHYDEAAQAKRGWEFVAEPGLARGELRLTTAMSSLDVSLASRIDTLMANFIKANWSRFHDAG